LSFSSKHSLPGAGAATTHDAVVGGEDVSSIRNERVAVNGCVADVRTASCIKGCKP
jgi:hypothetical protein